MLDPCEATEGRQGMKTSSFHFPAREICSSTGDKRLSTRSCFWVRLQILVRRQKHRTTPFAVSLSAPHKIPQKRGSALPALIFNSFKQSLLSQGAQHLRLPKGRRKGTLFHQVLIKGKDTQEIRRKCSTCRKKIMGNSKKPRKDPQGLKAKLGRYSETEETEVEKFQCVLFD